MELAEFLRRHDTDLDAVVQQASTSLHLTDGDLLFLSGSFCEGIANERSDLDLFLITAQNDIAYTSRTDVIIIAGTGVVDVRVVQRSEVERLLDRFAAWTSLRPRNERNAAAFTDDERKLLHRITIGRPLYGHDEFARLQRRLLPRDLARHRLDVARHTAGTIHVDMAGLRADGDYPSMLFAAQDLLGRTADALLAAHLVTNHDPKWRARRLAELLDDWEADLPGRPLGLRAIDAFLTLNRLPEHADAPSATEYANRICAFSRRILGWAEWRLLAGAPHPLRAIALAPGDAVLPPLDLDVAIRYHDGFFTLGRLNTSGQIFRLTPDEYSLICLFDGETRVDDATDAVRQMLAVVRIGELEMRKLVDETALRRILHGSA